ncbi:hypothetical protein K3Z87_28750, partial [Pseudomonas aeruginosa]|nr:hypothetical protein [Pseudomonas aeruginosa]
NLRMRWVNSRVPVANGVTVYRGSAMTHEAP